MVVHFLNLLFLNQSNNLQPDAGSVWVTSIDQNTQIWTRLSFSLSKMGNFIHFYFWAWSEQCQSLRQWRKFGHPFGTPSVSYRSGSTMKGNACTQTNLWQWLWSNTLLMKRYPSVWSSHTPMEASISGKGHNGMSSNDRSKKDIFQGFVLIWGGGGSRMRQWQPVMWCIVMTHKLFGRQKGCLELW